MDSTTVVRAARSAVGVPLNDIAAVAGIREAVMDRVMMDLTRRGHCDRLIAGRIADLDEADLAAVLRSKRCPASLVRLTRSDDPQSVRSASVGAAGWATRSPASPSAPRSVLCGHLHARTAETVKVQARDKSQARETVASNPGCAPAVLAGLAAGFDLADRGVRLALARNPGCDPAVLAVFAANPDERLCAAVAGEHPGCAPTVLAVLAADPDPAVRLRAADNPNCATAVLAGLAADGEHWGVRSAAAANPNIAAAVLVELAVADVHMVRAAAASQPAVRR